jgi:NAD(P)-dependent dehydrogenase (short-subunit alcohol dehydrogenase family)
VQNAAEFVLTPRALSGPKTGICRVFPILEYPDDVLEQTINVNIKGVFHCLRAELALVEDGGSIVNMSSAAGLIGAPGFSVYCASKHAVLGLTKTASQEIAHRKIRVNAICP